MENTHRDKEIEPRVELGLSLEETLKSLGAIEVSASLADLLTGGLPIFSALVSLKDAPRSVSDYLLAKKLVSFLSEISKVLPSKRAKMVEKLEREPEYVEQVGDQILLLLDRLDDLRKSRLMGRAFRAYCEGHIDGAMLTRINRAISTLNIRDLVSLKDIYMADVRHNSKGDPTGGLFYPASPHSSSLPESLPEEVYVVAVQNYLIAGLGLLRQGGIPTGVFPVDDLCIAIIKHVLEAPVRVYEPPQVTPP